MENTTHKKQSGRIVKEDTNRLSIKSWALEDRPREKLLSKDIRYLTDAELVSIIIRAGNKNESAVELSKKILESVDHKLNKLGKLTLNDLQRFKGIGEVKAITIIAALELGKRRKSEEIIEKQKISNSLDIFDYFKPKLGDLDHEEFWILFLNHGHRILNDYKLSHGGISETAIDIRLILKNALERHATTIIVCHNHPSGNVRPSNEDIKITKKIKDACKLMDISLLDHIIVTDNNYYSFADEGTM
jgi:DNA repair protein RadC